MDPNNEIKWQYYGTLKKASMVLTMHIYEP